MSVVGTAVGHFALGDVAGNVGQPASESVEDGLVDLLLSVADRFVRVLALLLDGQIIVSDSDGRTVQQAPSLQPMERAEGHLVGPRRW